MTVAAMPWPEGAPQVVFSVRDTGMGIGEDAVAHVFERYWQSREQAARGSGLGLFIAKGIVESHGGKIWVTSRPGEGSDFRFTVPAVCAPQPVAHPAAGPQLGLVR